MAKITARAGGVDGSATLVVDQRAASVEMTPSSLPAFSALGDTVRLAAEAFDANDYPIVSASFAWSTTDALVASVDGTGLVTIEGSGSAVIRATVDGVDGSVSIDVDQVVDTVLVEPPSAEITALGAFLALHATALDANGFEVTGKSFNWVSSEPTVATITSNGLAQSVGNGTTMITATTDDVTGQARVTVRQSVDSVSVVPSSANIQIDETIVLTATALDSNGYEIEDATFVWESSNAAVALVTALGAVTGKSSGVATISAFSGMVEGTCEVFVGMFLSGARQTGRSDR
jgi:uncharacterized protein YjdB